MSDMGHDGPDLQFPVKGWSKEMAIAKIGSWKRIKKVETCLVGRKSVVWMYDWQEEPYHSYVMSDSSCGGVCKDRKSWSNARRACGRSQMSLGRK